MSTKKANPQGSAQLFVPLVRQMTRELLRSDDSWARSNRLSRLRRLVRLEVLRSTHCSPAQALAHACAERYEWLAWCLDRRVAPRVDRRRRLRAVPQLRVERHRLPPSRCFVRPWLGRRWLRIGLQVGFPRLRLRQAVARHRARLSERRQAGHVAHGLDPSSWLSSAQ